MKTQIRSLLIAGLLGLGTAEAQAQYGYAPPMQGNTRPYTAQMPPGYPGAMPPMPLRPIQPPVWPGMQVDYAQDPAAMVAPEAMQAPQKGDGSYIDECTSCIDVCCSGIAEHRFGAFADFLYLRPRDAEVTYGVPFNGPIVAPDPTVQVGRYGVLDPDFSPGYRVGANFALDRCSSLQVSYTNFESNTTNNIDVANNAIFNLNSVVRANLIHPNTVTAGFGSQFNAAGGGYGVDFQIADVDYRGVLRSTPDFALNYVIGARYGSLSQDLDVRYVNPGVMTVLSHVNFEGAGLKLGFDGEKHHLRTGLFGYARSNVSFLGGDVRASFQQTDLFAGPLVDTSWKAGRVVTTLDLELGFGWQNPCGNFRWNVGYLYSGWYNTLQTDEWIQAVQTNSLANLGGSATTFDGLTTRIELRY